MWKHDPEFEEKRQKTIRKLQEMQRTLQGMQDERDEFPWRDTVSYSGLELYSFDDAADDIEKLLKTINGEQL